MFQADHIADVALHLPMVACHVMDYEVGHQIATLFDGVSLNVKHLSMHCAIWHASAM